MKKKNKKVGKNLVNKKSKNEIKKSDIKIKRVDYGVIGLFKENRGISKIAKEFKKDFLKDFPKEKDQHFFHHTYTYQTRHFLGLCDLYIKLCNFLDTPANMERLDQYFHGVANPNLNRDVAKFKENFQRLIDYFEKSDEFIYLKLKMLSKKECFRLYEAIKCLESDCNYAAVVMSVSAVESRLHKLLQTQNNKLYKEYFEKATLGGILSIFRDDSYKDKKFNCFKNVLPDKHKPLVEMLNIYRIFSAHPQDETITDKTAEIIVSLSFLLLIDSNLKIDN